MTLDLIADKGIVLLGCGKMGSAMLKGWLDAGLSHDAVTAIDPYPSDWLKDMAAKGLHLNWDLPREPAVCLLAVKPQMMRDALPRLAALGNGPTLFISIAAGTTILTLEDLLGRRTPIVRAMPNTPAAIGRGITALVGNAGVDEDRMALAEALLSGIGRTVRLDGEAQMDAVTALSGSGPAYVFHLIETMEAAGIAEGLPPAIARELAVATVEGAGALAAAADEPPAKLRENVTSPNGTTAAALGVLMDEERGFPPLLRAAIAAARKRSEELSLE
ncbi:pyrroline-5-carboxylate reductase [Oceanomicrobium pacificus]|uniref:Pyrroline-5-carboxylate reductase n=1 Tax=Oceanomicrobium pacificus TaxID=2692916 RepID=A0A6B0TTA4_9RHOB|nr:pyrroline-5-carboxylate reductase [Oceanomicrobium pacificus]MXU64213.1 pyrroline-5-carboxylate reductase [Oceanomicrobium pacificus]